MPIEKAVGKLKTALDARKDKDFMIIARTEGCGNAVETAVSSLCDNNPTPPGADWLEWMEDCIINRANSTPPGVSFPGHPIGGSGA